MRDLSHNAFNIKSVLYFLNFRVLRSGYFFFTSTQHIKEILFFVDQQNEQKKKEEEICHPK